MARFVIVPQWQGSSSSRAMQLVDGADAIAGDLPRASCVRVEVPLEAGDAQGTRVSRLSALAQVRAAVHDAVTEGDGPAIVIGGDCGVSLGAVEAVAGDDLAVLWIDAHADLNTPETSPSGAFHGMVLRAITGEGETELRMEPGIAPARLVLAGTRALDLEEELFLAGHGIRPLSVDDLGDPAALADAVAATGASRVYVHVDLDVLDPSEISGVSFPEPFGVSTAHLTAALRVLKERIPVAGATVSEFSPASPTAAADDLATILRVIGALA